MTELERPWSVRDAAAWLQVDPETVRKWARSGRLRGVQLGKRWRFRGEDVRALVEVEAPDVADARSVLAWRVSAALDAMRKRTRRV